MPSYTAVLLPNDDGSMRAYMPALPTLEGAGATRAAALEDVKKGAENLLAEMLSEGHGAPREESSPVRTVWVRNPRRGDTVPYVVMIRRTESGDFNVMPVAFPDMSVEMPTAEAAIDLIGPLLFERLTTLVAQGRHFPTQDDPQAYVVRVGAPTQSAEQNATSNEPPQGAE